MRDATFTDFTFLYIIDYQRVSIDVSGWVCGVSWNSRGDFRWWDFLESNVYERSRLTDYTPGTNLAVPEAFVHIVYCEFRVFPSHLLLCFNSPSHSLHETYRDTMRTIADCLAILVLYSYLLLLAFRTLTRAFVRLLGTLLCTSDQFLAVLLLGGILYIL